MVFGFGVSIRWVDFACPQLWLAIELDGSQHDEGRSKDEWRSEKLAEEGYRVLRFWNNEVLGNLDGVIGCDLCGGGGGREALGVGLDCLLGTGPLCPSDISPLFRTYLGGGNPAPWPPVYSPPGITRCRFACAPPLSFGHFPLFRTYLGGGNPAPWPPRSPSP